MPISNLNTAAHEMTLKEWRLFMMELLRSNPNASAVWDIMTALRGPDSPSERPDMDPVEASSAYAGRRKRKYDTVEVVRAKAFYGVCGGQARSHADEAVTLPPSQQWDHFDKHVARAARWLKLGVKERRDDAT